MNPSDVDKLIELKLIQLCAEKDYTIPIKKLFEYPPIHDNLKLKAVCKLISSPFVDVFQIYSQASFVDDVVVKLRTDQTLSVTDANDSHLITEEETTTLFEIIRCNGFTNIGCFNYDHILSLEKCSLIHRKDDSCIFHLYPTQCPEVEKINDEIWSHLNAMLTVSKALDSAEKLDHESQEDLLRILFHQQVIDSRKRSPLISWFTTTHNGILCPTSSITLSVDDTDSRPMQEDTLYNYETCEKSPLDKKSDVTHVEVNTSLL